MFAKARAVDIQDFKAISQNVMHSNIGITDQIYGGLLEGDQHARMLSISGREQSEASGGDIDLDALAEKIAKKMRGNSG